MKDMVDVTVHIDKNIEHDRRVVISDKVREINGVLSASLHDESPHLMIVEYDPDATSAASILECVKQDGVKAELIGM